MRFDVTALGELVIDMVPVAGSERLFSAKPGGAPGNVAAGVARLGLRAAMLSKVGPGPLGDLLITTLSQAGVDTRGIVRAEVETTALAVVSVDAKGERDFVLYREACADASFAADEVALDIVRASRVLHVGSLSLATPASAGAQRLAIATAIDAGALISADVNFRPAIWRDQEAMLATGREAIARADIVKVNETELFGLAGMDDLFAAVGAIWHPRLKVLAVTRGVQGAEMFTPTVHCHVPGFAVTVIDTVGCGDAFMASLLAGLIEAGLAALNKAALFEIGRSACAAGAALARVAGAMENMPRRAEIAALLTSAS
jgi:sugar/nucleoside kinase (ribokinase family)